LRENGDLSVPKISKVSETHSDSFRLHNKADWSAGKFASEEPNRNFALKSFGNCRRSSAAWKRAATEKDRERAVIYYIYAIL